MSRPIKFRAHDKRFKKTSLPFGLFQGVFWADAHIAMTEDTEIVQFTGLLDRTGKEIYEGDILSLDGKPDSVIVPTTDGDFPAGLTERYFKPRYPLPGMVKHKEVIGNIYENPELVKETEGGS